MTTSIVLKRNASLKRISIGALFGSFSLVFLFFPISSFFLFLFKILLAAFMQIFTFQFKDLKYFFNNLGYFYMISIILGGFLYYLNTEFSYTHFGMLFIQKGFQISPLFLLLFSPIIFFIYIKQMKKMKSVYQFVYKVTIVLKNNQKLILNGFLDTGNKLVDPITQQPVIFISKNKIDVEQKLFYYVHYKKVGSDHLLKCIKPLYIEINGKRYKNYLLGLSDKKFSLEGVECLLNHKLLEG